ncbi:hypothetical protein [Pseudomonas putida]|uniref:Uncharacterized protein n=1 Tax=Pseudomonas putida TaxID=303 RepID=A0A8I1EBL0_PSEPU|nr:hypothetical protein [Pseudomonas putida]MBI6882661.1 hypothetical protein [Pseudomonas putida]
MPSQSQRRAIGKTTYASGSPIRSRNEALKLAKAISPLGCEDSLCAGLLAAGKATKLIDYCTNGPESEIQVSAGREPFLLVEDMLNPGSAITVPIFDAKVDAVEKNSGLCGVTLGQGDALFKSDVLVYWR